MNTLTLDIRCTDQSKPCLAAKLAYPVTLGLNLVFVFSLTQAGINLETVFLVGFFVSLASMAVLERVLPYRLDWQATGKDWMVNGIYFLINGATDNAGKLIAAALALYFAPETTGNQGAAGFLGAALLALLVNDLIGYWWHRLGHEVSLLWRFHGIHHVPEKLYMFNNNTVHFVDILVSGVLSGTALIALGFPAEAIALALYLSSFHSFFAHVNADVRMGVLGYVLMGPEHHRYHHSTKLEEAQNYGACTALWDQVFGTFIYRPGQAPESIGIAGEHRFPETHNILKNIASPFRK